MARISQVRVEGLFGYLDHAVGLREIEPTIITAPNGAGKTHILRLVNAALKLDYVSLLQLPFRDLQLLFDDESTLTIERVAPTDDNGGELTLSLVRPREQMSTTATISGEDLAIDESELPSHIRRVSAVEFIDLRSDAFLTLSEVERRFWHKDVLRPAGHSQVFRSFVATLKPVFIDTKRLDSDRTAGYFDPRRRGEHKEGARESIERYISQIRRYVVAARQESVNAAQSADGTFAARALSVANTSVKEQDLRRRYDEIVKTHSTLARNGLAVGEEPLAFPDKTTPTVRRILSVFLDDWEKRLAPLVPVSERIGTLRDILDSKLRQSGKTTQMQAEGTLSFKLLEGGKIPVTKLSSGEQHLVALFTMMLFSAETGSVVLIDEPEISMHAAWKHAFLEDVEKVAAITDLQVVIATHSTSIINGRWDLTEELTFESASADQIERLDFEFDVEIDG